MDDSLISKKTKNNCYTFLHENQHFSEWDLAFKCD